MSAIAQRRTAAAAAIMMLLAVLQYVLFAVHAAPAGADHIPETGTLPGNCEKIEGDQIGEEFALDPIDGVTISFSNWEPKPGDPGEYESVDITVSGLDSNQSVDWQLKWASTGVDEGSITTDGTYTAGVSGSQAISHVTVCVETGPGEASVTFEGECDFDKEVYALTVTSTNAVTYIDLNANGVFEPSEGEVIVSGYLEIDLPGGTVVEWESVADEGFVFDDGETTISGSFVIDDCKPSSGEVTVSVSGECEYDGEAIFTYTVTADAGVTVDFDGGDQNLTDGETYQSSSSSASWVATAPEGTVFSGESSGTANVEDCTPSSPPPTNPPTNPPTDPPTRPEVKSALGDLVWFDENQNGQQDDPVDEFPINGATVTLLTPDGIVLAQQVTGLDGLYLFDELDAGNYRVEVCVEGADYTVPNAPGVPDDLDSDVFPLADKPGCAMTGLIGLPAGVTDLTWDAGLIIDVGGIQIEPTTTTIPPVTVDTLPFTGFEVEDMALLGIGVLAAGSVLLLLMGRRDDEPADEVVSGWTNN